MFNAVCSLSVCRFLVCFILTCCYGAMYESGKDYLFTTCGALGSKGPNQKQCGAEYRDSPRNISVTVSDGVLSGVQAWFISEAGSYSITAIGASGGLGTESGTQPARGAYVHGKFFFEKGDEILMLIGQQGESACLKAGFESESFCILNNQSSIESQGGGGGGGGTFVFQRDKNDKLKLLVAAGGGSGLPYLQMEDVKILAGGLTINGSGKTGHTINKMAGAGGGLKKISNTSYLTGQAVFEGAQGGIGCTLRYQNYQWTTNGGFGGGGGACLNGGGGGGYSGGNISIIENIGETVQGGSSYVSSIAQDTFLSPGINDKGAGYVEIVQILDCPCELMCLWSDYETCQFKCLCPLNKTLSEDGKSCIVPSIVAIEVKEDSLSLVYIILISILALSIITSIPVVICCCYSQKKKKKERNMKLHRQTPINANNLNHQLLLPSMLNNPNYRNIIPTDYLQLLLHEIPGKDLTLTHLLGQGAFGDVYQGCLQTNNQSKQVAVKTLPTLCTEQMEIDFLMEAVIISKFNHANIVRCIGVCFEKDLKYIILELLEGGDLQLFLRNIRLNPNESVTLQVKDLLKLALDIAKGCQHLQEKHFIHRDIAARNCLVTTKNSDRVAKIADFGLARDIYRSAYYKKRGSSMLPVKWMPPESYLDGLFTSKTDVWSFGVLLWEIFALGHVPYPGFSNEEVMQYVADGGRLDTPAFCPSIVFDIMASCWRISAEERPSFLIIIHLLEKCLQNEELSSQNLPLVREQGRNQYLSNTSYLLCKRPLYNQNNDSLEPLITNSTAFNPSSSPEYNDSVFSGSDGEYPLSSIQRTHRPSSGYISEFTDTNNRPSSSSEPGFPLTDLSLNSDQN